MRHPSAVLTSLFASAILAALALSLDYWQSIGISLETTRWLGWLYVVLIHLLPALIYPTIFRQTNSFRWSLALSMVPTICWWLSELAMRLRWNSLAEALWLVFSPGFFLQLSLVLLLIGVAHLLSVLIHRQRPSIKASAGYITIVVVIFLAAPLSIFPFLNGYQSVFQSDLLPIPQSLPGRLDPSSVTTTKQDLPNIVFILSDDHRYDYSGYANHPFIETPNIDRLAAEGVVFNRAYVNTALCSPSRASFLTGVSSYQHGVWNNFTPWSEDNRTFFEYLKPAGYSTAFIGKWHMPGNKLPDIAGLDHFISFTAVGGQGQYTWNPMIVNGVHVDSRTRYIATELTDYAIEWVKEQNGPFVLYLSHKSVHASFDPDEPDIDRYVDAEVDIPEGSHLWSTHTRNQYVHLTRTPIDRSIIRYGEAIHSMDREIGRLLDHLDTSGLRDNTIVIYTSDNGYQWGEHQLTDKRWAFEESIRIPFVMRLPGNEFQGETRQDIIANVDVAATFLDAAGIDKPDYMEGQSLISLLRDPNTNWRDFFFYSYFFEPPYPTPTSFAVVGDRYKLIETDWLGYELYDLKSDAREQNNLAGDPQYKDVLAAMAKQLSQEKQRADNVN